MFKNYKEHFNNNGSVLVLLVIIITVIMVLNVSLMSITLANYKIKKTNTEIKQSFYMSETGLNITYVKALALLEDAVNDSILKAEDYLISNPADETGAANLYKNNFKSYLIGRLGELNDNSNPFIRITNVGTFYFIGDTLTVSIQSKYVSSSNIEKVNGVDLVITIPDYYEIIAGITDYSPYLNFDNYNIIY